jgi:hypothetical protein
MDTRISEKIDLAVQELETKMVDYTDKSIEPSLPVVPYDNYELLSSERFLVYPKQKPTIQFAGTIEIRSGE